MLDKLEETRRRIARNKVIREQNNERLNDQLRHAVQADSVNELFGADLSEVISLGKGVKAVSSVDPFD